MAYEFITYEQGGHVVTITINRPERVNAIHPPTSDELSEAWSTFAADEDAWVGILTGAGDRAFSAGNDLKYTAENPGARHERRKPVRGGFGGITADFDCSKPMIAAINGYALGGGLEMALACDIIIASETAALGLPEVTVGLMAGGGGVHRLPRHIPLKVAMGYIFTGRHMSAEEAYRLGLVNEVVAQDDVLPAARRWADEILQASPLSVRASKATAYGSLDMPLSQSLTHQFHEQRVMFSSEDAIEGPKAFAEKRKPDWKAR